MKQKPWPGLWYSTEETSEPSENHGSVIWSLLASTGSFMGVSGADFARKGRQHLRQRYRAVDDNVIRIAAET